MEIGILWFFLILEIVSAQNRYLPQYELDALYDLYNATNGAFWKWDSNSYYAQYGIEWDFSPGAAPCMEHWDGIKCVNSTTDESLAFVQSIKLDHFNMTGSIPTSIGNFSMLEQIDFSFNNIFKSIPIEVGKLSHLFSFALNNNVLTGRIPEELYDKHGLMYLLLQDNYLVGSISPKIGNLTILSSIRLELNELTGTIPPQVSNCTQLGVFVTSYNHLRGKIPPELGLINKFMFSFMVDNNELTGPLPRELGGMCNIQMYSIYANNNRLTGTIPNVFDNCTNLQYLYLDNNTFHGPLPPMKLGHLGYLSLANNQLTGTIPVTSAYTHGCFDLDLSNNLLNGSIPQEIFQKTSFNVYLNNNSFSGHLIMTVEDVPYRFDASYNQLSGPIPSLVFNDLISFLDLSFNKFDGTIPEAIGNAYQLSYMSLNNNQLYGSLPEVMVNLTLLASIVVSNNQLSGTIPSFVQHVIGFPFLQVLDVQNNHLEGTIPPSVLGSSFVLIFAAGENYLTGSIPEPSDLQAISGLSLNYNLLTGSIPDLSPLKSLQLLFLDDNMLSGDLELVFDGSMQKVLKYVDVSNNQLSGTIPTSPFELQSLMSFAAVSNCLYGSLPTEAICALSNLTTLAMDGMESAKSCQYLYLPGMPGVYDAYGLYHKVTGGIAPCLFSMPALQTLHLSGNEITGRLPGDVIISESLRDLSLSHNALTGSIPEYIQFHRWTNLDLSYNKLTGGLSHQFPAFSDNASLSLEVNRLSGVIPHSLKHAKIINILDGNLWKCDLERSQLPTHDKNAGIYECGSNSFNYAIYIWMALCCAAVIPLLLVWKEVHPKERISRWKNDLTEWLSIFEGTQDRIFDTQHVLELGAFADGIRRTCVCLTVFIVCILMPVYIGLTWIENTYAYEYAWTVSAAYLSGLTSTIVLLVCFAVLSLVTVALVRKCVKINPSEALSSYLRRCPAYLAFGFVTVLVVNIIVVTAVNIGYVYVYATYAADIVHTTQFALAIFKLVWNNWAVREMLKLTKKLETRQDQVENRSRYGRHRIGLEVFMILFNNFGAPYIATALVSTNCFYNIIAAPPKVDVSYTYQACLTSTLYVNGSICLAYENAEVVSTSYEPPFLYSYQCGSTFITTYATIYVLMSMITAFVAPLALIAANICYHTSEGGLHDMIGALMPKILKLTTITTTSSAVTEEAATAHDEQLLGTGLYDPVFHCDLFVVKVINMFAMILTFGAVLPPLAVVGLVAVVSFTYYSQLLIGRFVVRAGAGEDRSRVIESMNRDCEHAADMFMNAVWIVVPFAAVFYAILLLDTLGDGVGWRRALWAPIVVVTVPFGVWFLRRIHICVS